MKDIDKEGKLILEQTKHILRSYDKSRIKCHGTVKLQCLRHGNHHFLEFYVVNEDLTPILGAKACIDLELLLINVRNVNKNSPLTMDKLES